MKYSIVILLTLILSETLAQTDCSPYIPVSKGSKWEITSYSTKDKETGKAAYELIEKAETDSGMVFTIKTTTYDKKGEMTYENTYQAFCVNGKFKIDMAFKMNGGGMQTTEDMDIDINASNMEIPTMSATAGDNLKDASLIVTASTNSISIFRMTVLITERKVVAKEEKTTEAGAFNCLVLYQKISTKMIMNMVAYSKEWYAEEI